MNAHEIARRLALLVDVRGEVPRYVRQHVVFRARSRHNSTWLETPEVVQVSAAVGGFSLEVDPRDEIGRFLFLYGIWDLLTTRLLQRVLHPGMTVLDVGANVGYFSLLAAERVGAAGLVQSFEPHDEIRDRLARNVARSGFSNVEIRAEAVTNRVGEIRFYRSADASNQGISSTVQGPAPHGELRDEQPQLVPAVRLDDVAGSLHRSIDLVKVDVEGAERAVFEGGQHLLSAADAPLLVFEAYDVGSTADVLEASGFTIRRLVHDRRRGIRLVQAVGSTLDGEPNYVAFKARHERALAGLI